MRKCLKLLNLDYLDAFLIHWPITGNRGDTLSPPTRETWAALEAVQAKGLVRHLGVSNFSVAKMQDIMSYAKVPISIAQCESHPYFRNDALVNWCTANGVHFTAFSPLVRRASRPPSACVALTQALRRGCRARLTAQTFSSARPRR